MRRVKHRSRKIIVQQNGQRILVDDDLLDQIKYDIVGTRITTVENSRNGYRVQKHLASLLRATGPNAGLLSVLRCLARGQGLILQHQLLSGICGLPIPEMQPELKYPHIADFVRDHHRGLIRVPRHCEPAEIISDLVTAYPTQKIMVLGNHARQLRRISAILVAKKVRAVSINSRVTLWVPDDIDEADMPQVICSTPLEAGTADFARANIVVLLDAFSCGQDRMQVALSQTDARFRLFGLARDCLVPAPSQADATFAVFGPDLLELHGIRRARRDTNIAWVPTPRQMVGPCGSAIELFKKCYWHHDRRNRRICQLAKLLRAGAPIAPSTFRDVAQWLGDAVYQPPTVTILVDRPIHAAVLSTTLPDWPVVISDAALDGLNGAFRNSVKRLRQQGTTAPQQIVVADTARRFPGHMSDVVIWAGGGSDVAALPTGWLGSQYGINKPLLIVDFDDAHNGDARQMTRQREQAYHQRDIYPVGTSLALGRLTRFLCRQQEFHNKKGQK